MNDRFKFRSECVKNNEFDGFVYFELGQKIPKVERGAYLGKAEQCTGSKDRKGKLIYEGDIVKHWFGDRYIKCIVRYDELLCGFAFFDKKGRMYPIHDDCEIIGNINEDPELLEN